MGRLFMSILRVLASLRVEGVARIPFFLVLSVVWSPI